MLKKTDSDFQDLFTYLLLFNIHKRLSIPKTGIAMLVFKVTADCTPIIKLGKRKNNSVNMHY